jgi:hypothetical protein
VPVFKPDVVPHAYTPSTWEAEAERSLEPKSLWPT